MAWTSGTADNHYHLLILLKLYVAGLSWTVNSFTDDGGATTNGPGTILSISGPGAAGNQVFLNIRTVNSLSGPYNSWEMRGAVAYTGASWGNNPGESPPTYLNLWDGSIDYWFFVNDRRIIVVAKTSTVYASAYLGFFLPWATPTQYPFPLLIAGDWSVPTDWSTQNTGRRMCCDPGGTVSSVSGAWLRDPAGLWNAGCNAPNNSTPNDQGVRIPGGPWFQVWPWAVLSSQQSVGTTGWGVPTLGGSSGDCALDWMVATRQGERWVLPCTLLSANGPHFGSLDGLFNSFGAGLSAETIVSAGARDFIAFQNIHRNSGNDFFLCEQA